MASNEFFGWDLLYKSVQDKITSEADIVIALAHWFLISNSSFRCLGLGEDKVLHENETGSELLPDGWNENENTYALRYVSDDKKLFILLATKVEDNTLLLNLLDSNSRNVSNLLIDPKETVKSRNGSIKTMIPNINLILDRFKKELVEPIFIGNLKDAVTQTRKEQQQQQHSPRSETIPPPPSFDPLGSFSPNIPRPYGDNPLRDIGRGDLDPFGRGGGMLFPQPGSGNDPFNIRPRFPGLRFPPPPGSRYDPIGPLDPRTGSSRSDPNPDHFRPPPDFDDMYM